MNETSSTEIRFKKRQARHLLGSGIWLLVFSALFVALVIVADAENLLTQEDMYIQALVNLILGISVMTWVLTGIWFIQRKKPRFMSTAPPGARYIVAGIIITACISFTAFIAIAYRTLGTYLQGEYAWGTYVVFGLLGFFLFGGAWHLARLVKPDFVKRKERPFTRKGPKMFYVSMCIAMLVGTGSLFVSIGTQFEATGVPHQFTVEAGTTNTNVILLVGDGMGNPHIELGRLVERGPGSECITDRFLYKTNISTSHIDGGVTDSAAAATAMATGYRTQSGRISQTWNGTNLDTILDRAKANGYATGLISICQMTHATPAAFAANRPNRNMYLEIAGDMVAREVDVLLGGGRGDGYFGTHVDTMVDDMGYSYAINKTEMGALASTPALGLFASGNLRRAQEYTETMAEPTLLEMVEKGIELLNSTGKPFFLMVEASAIDWAGHANNPVYAAHEMIEFERVANHVLDLADVDPTLQVLFTADHETGGLRVLGHEFITPVPNVTDSLAEKIAKRTARANEVHVSWSTGGHTNDKVILAGSGPYTSQLGNASHLTDVFSLMRMAIEGQSGPVVPGLNDGYFPLGIVMMAFWGMVGTAIALAALYAWKKVKRSR